MCIYHNFNKMVRIKFNNQQAGFIIKNHYQFKEVNQYDCTIIEWLLKINHKNANI